MDSLIDYRRKRNFRATPEPAGARPKKARGAPRFVVQKHRASHLHYDFRLEAAGVLKSWAVPKGPSLDPDDKRLAMRVEDHPLEYYDFEGVIPEGNYGAGSVIVWDWGTYRLAEGDDEARQIESGKIKFVMRGKKLNGLFTLVKMRGKNAENNAWLLVKDRDEGAQAGWSADEHDASVKSGRTLDEVARNPRSRKWISSGPDATRRALQRTPSPARVEAGFTNLDKKLWPKDGYTKGDLIRYYVAVSRWLLPYLKDRPLTLERYPDGIDAESFFEKNAPQGTPPWVRTVALPSEGKRSTIHYIVCNDVQTLAYLANLAAITLHAWLSRVGSLDSPDYLLFDLDPWKGCTLGTLARVALGVRTVLTGVGMEPAVKTSGGTGLHVMVRLAPAYDYEQVKMFGELVARRVAAELGKAVTLERMTGQRRAGAVYIDYVQMGKGKTIVFPFVVRPRRNAPVSMPLAWSEVETLAKSKERDPTRAFARWSIASVPDLLRRRGDPWVAAMKKRQRMEPALAKARKAWPKS